MTGCAEPILLSGGSQPYPSDLKSELLLISLEDPEVALLAWGPDQLQRAQACRYAQKFRRHSRLSVLRRVRGLSTQLSHGHKTGQLLTGDLFAALLDL